MHVSYKHRGQKGFQTFRDSAPSQAPTIPFSPSDQRICVLPAAISTRKGLLTGAYSLA